MSALWRVTPAFAVMLLIVVRLFAIVRFAIIRFALAQQLVHDLAGQRVAGGRYRGPFFVDCPFQFRLIPIADQDTGFSVRS